MYFASASTSTSWWCLMFLQAFLVFSVDAAKKQRIRTLGEVGYSCPNMGPSRAVPTSAHAVRPGDIKIVAALGDSLTAGNGASGSTISDVLFEHRELAFQGGGAKTLEKHVTIPNILKKFNPALTGFATGSGRWDDWSQAHFSIGFPFAESSDLEGQAQALVQMLRARMPDTYATDWKLINMFIGGNDACNFCKDSLNNPTGPRSPAAFGANIRRALLVLQRNLPRTIVSLTGMLNLRLLRDVDKGNSFCKGIHALECECSSDPRISDAQLTDLCTGYMSVEQMLQDSGEFDTRDDFTLVIQPFLRSMNTPPLLRNGSVDLSYFAADCFHFSQLGHAAVAKNLWNNILQPIGRKATTADLTDLKMPLSCPDPRCPFIRTTRNSRNCSAYVAMSTQDRRRLRLRTR